MIENELRKNNGKCMLVVNGKTVPVCISTMKHSIGEVTEFTGHFRELEPERLYITTASRPDDRYMNKCYGDILNTTYLHPQFKFDDEIAVNYCNDYMSRIKELVEYDKKYSERKKMKIEKVIFNNPATIVFWKDGTKTVVKAQDEPFDEEKGLAMAIAKKALGNQGRYFEEFKKWLPEIEEEPVEPCVFFDGKALATAVKKANDALDKLAATAKTLVNEDKCGVEVKRYTCDDCVKQGSGSDDCKVCVTAKGFDPSHFELKPVKKTCANCRYEETNCVACMTCLCYNNFEAEE